MWWLRFRQSNRLHSQRRSRASPAAWWRSGWRGRGRYNWRGKPVRTRCSGRQRWINIACWMRRAGRCWMKPCGVWGYLREAITGYSRWRGRSPIWRRRKTSARRMWPRRCSIGGCWKLVRAFERVLGRRTRKGRHALRLPSSVVAFQCVRSAQDLEFRRQQAVCQGALAEDEAAVADEAQIGPVDLRVEHVRGAFEIERWILCEQRKNRAVIIAAFVQKERLGAARALVDVDPWAFADVMQTPPLPPVGFVKMANAAGEQRVLVTFELRVLFAEQHATRLAGVDGGRTDEFLIAVRMREDAVGARHRADAHVEQIAQRHRVTSGKEHQLAIDEGEGAPVMHGSVKTALFPAKDGAVRHGVGEDAGVAGLDEVGDRAFAEQFFVEATCSGELGEFTRHDKNQFAARAQMTDRLFDEKQIQVAASVEQVAIEQAFGFRADVLIANIRRVADHAVELLGFGIGEEITHPSALRCHVRVDFHRFAARDVCAEGAVSGGWFERTPTIATQRKHLLHDRGRRKDLAEFSDVERSHGSMISCR